MPAIFLASQMPPTRPRAICRIEAARNSSTRPNSYFVVRRSHRGHRDGSSTRHQRHFSGRSGGVGSSNHSGLYCSICLAKRMAPDAVNWPWVPNSRSALSPHRFADELAELGAQGHRFQRRLARVERGIGGSGVKLDSGEAYLGIMCCAFCRSFGIPVDRVVLTLGKVRVNIGVGPQLLVHASTRSVHRSAC